jgi:hypothetical protein
MSDETIQETPLEIVQNERRLPLYPQDGRHVQDTVVSLSPRVETVLGVLPAGPNHGFVRLFVSGRSELSATIAVLDPAIGALKVGLV